MQRKLLAVAVAGALAAPAIAVAQSTVQIYGTAVIEYGWADQGAGRPNMDYGDGPGSEIGVKGVEQLGGGLSAWFQCSTTADLRGFDKVGLCSRNSAIGFRGGFGNLFTGKWDTPMKRALNIGTVGAEETGILGMSFLPFGGSGGSVAAYGLDAGADGFGDSQQRQRFKRRETCLTTYETPSFGGFQVMGAVSCGNGVSDNGITDGDRNQKPRVWSFAGTYVNGPIGVGLTYEKHVDFGSRAAGADLDDDAWGISAAYTFGGKVKLGATYLDREWETGPGASTSQKTWTVGVDWAIAGPHSVQFQYARAGDSKGNGTGIGGNGGVAAPGSDTGADAVSIAYTYSFSKRTSIKLGYVRVDNDSNTRSARVGNTAALTTNGENTSGVAFKVRHTF